LIPLTLQRKVAFLLVDVSVAHDTQAAQQAGRASYASETAR